MATLENVLCMTGGEGKTSYAKNSEVQKRVISYAKTILEDAITDFYAKKLPKCLRVADLGCSSGPNTLIVASEVIDAIHFLSKKLGCVPPEFQITLNDLYGNDFNTVFKSIPNFIEKHRKEKGEGFGDCFISGMPGSFYGRLFPSETLHFVHSSYCLHFLSQVPQGIGNTGGNMYIAKNSPQLVLDAYLNQYQKDFTLFLDSRSKEIVPGGRMVLTLIGRRSTDPTTKECCQLWELLAQSLRDMIAEGTLEQAKLDSFNLIGYYPCGDELKSIIQEQGSFNLDLLETFELDWDTSNNLSSKDFVFDKKTSGLNVSNCIRAVLESIIANHFGAEIIETLFQKYADHLGEYLATDRGYYVNHVMSLTKKE